MRVVVVGAGALGCAAALALAEAGHEVTLLERDQVGSGTTGLAAGILSLGLMDREDQALTSYSMDRFAALDAADERAGADTGPLLQRPGSHLLVGAEAAQGMVPRVAAGLDALGVSHALWAPQAWRAHMAERGVDASTDRVARVLSVDRDAWALSTEGTNLMFRAARRRGVAWRHGRRVRHLLRRGPRVTGVALDDGTRVPAEAVVLAAGAWTRALLAEAGLALPARAFRTHACVLRTPLAPRLPILHDEPGGYYLRPEGPRHVLVGNGTRTDDTPVEDFDVGAEPDFVPDVAARLVQRLPEAATAGLQNAWRGLLTGTPDRHPLVGAHPDAPGLWLCVGGNGIGFMRSPALGAVLAAALEGRGAPAGLPASILDWTDPGRFWPDPPQTFAVQEGFRLDG